MNNDLPKYRSKVYMLLFILFSLCSFQALSADESSDSSATVNGALNKTAYVYYQLEPDITTNYEARGDKLGFIRVQVVLMLNNLDEQRYVEHYTPLIRDALITILSRQKTEMVTSSSGQEQIRREALERVNELIIAETNHKLIHDLLFTKFLYQ